MLELPGYTLPDLVYEGSETRVYRGHRDRDRAPVAVKLTRSEFPTARELARLRRELAILRDLDVPGVVRAYALEPCGRGLALVMEDPGGCSLHELLGRRARLDVGSAIRFAIALAGCLDALHRKGIVHKDIKPHNVLITDEATCQPCLIDFGIAARLAQETAEAAAPEHLEGTLLYIAPEQTGRMSRAVDRRADLYSLGATLYEALTGAPPFAASDPHELVHCHLAVPPPPPRERAPEIPPAIADILLRLLAKDPEERYQTAAGLKADLEACLAALEASGDVPSFPLGEHDRPEQILMPQRLHGRARELSALLDALGRADLGEALLLLITGDPGVGKSALVGELQRPLADAGGSFAAGKFDPMHQDVPLAPVAHALGELVRRVLAEPPDALAAWRAEIDAALGPNARILVDLVPELELLLGPRPEVPALGPNEAKNRFRMAVARFLGAFAGEGSPLVLFLDDLQWADPASLHLLQALIEDPDLGHVLFIGAYREREVDAGHPLMGVLDALRGAGALAGTLALGPLDGPTVTELVADALRAPAAEIAPLAAAAFDKTGGNPFYLGQFLGALQRDGLLRFDPEARAWSFDLQGILGAEVTANVADLVARRLDQLTPAARRTLERAACIGHEFDLGTLAVISERSPGEAARDLWEALREGLLAPLQGDYRFLEGDGGAEDGGGFAVSYRFAHDRVREAAYGRIDPRQRAEVHLQIGRLLRARRGEAVDDADVIEIVRHMNLGAEAIRDEAERVDLARLNLRAGRRARARAAYQAAAAHLAAGRALLGEGGWERDRELCFALHIEGAEHEYLNGQAERAEALFTVALPWAGSALARARAQALRVVLYTTLGRFKDALEVGRAGLELCGVSLPETSEAAQAAFGQGLAEVAELLGGRTPEALLEAPELHDPVTEVAQLLLCELSIPIYFVNPALYGTAVLQQVILSLRHGHSRVSPFGYMTYGFLLAALLGRPEEGRAFGELALKLNERLPNPALTPKLNSVFCGYLYLCRPLREIFPYFERTRQTAHEAGDFVYLAAAWYAMLVVRLGAGEQLDDLRELAERGLAVVKRTGDVVASAVITLGRQYIACLQGRTRDRLSLSDEGFDEAAFVASLDPQKQGIALFYAHMFRLQARALHGDPAGALEAAAGADSFAQSAAGMYYTHELPFYAGLAAGELAAAAAPGAAAPHLAALARYRERLAPLAATAPFNFRHRLLLVDAAEARAAGRVEEAAQRCEEAIALAAQNGFRQDEAIANDLCARVYLGAGRPRPARGYLLDAVLGYRHWGALARAEDLVATHGALLAGLHAPRRPGASTSSPTSTSLRAVTVAGTGIREAAVIIRSVQAIAGELLLPRVIERLMRLVLENAGAQRGALLLSRAEQLMVEATFGVDPGSLQVGPSAPLEGRHDLPQAALLYAARTREPLLLDDPTAHRRFAADRYLAQARPRSVLCLPLLHQDRLSGVLYLEHGDASGAFTEAGVELLGLLGAQAAMAIENARLLADLRAAHEEVQRAKEELEAKVARRTEDLRASNAQLAEANQRLEVELTERLRLEADQASLQAQIIEVQRARLAELSTPFIPITDHIMVMPIIGSVDTDRAAQVLEVALTGAQRHGARVVILDITGMPHVDAAVAETLLRTVNALRLLGSAAILTGIRPEVAQALIGLDVRLADVTTLGTLQAGIARALEITGAKGTGARLRRR